MLRKIRLILDAIIAVSVLTLFSKNLFGIEYHELAGLGVLIPIIVHIMINVNVVIRMYRNYQKIPVTTKICLILDIVLVVVFIWMGISGVMISKTIFASISGKSMGVKATHKILGKLSVCLLGVHAGLHLCNIRLKSWVAVVLSGVAVVSLIVGAVNAQGGHRPDGNRPGGNYPATEIQGNVNNQQKSETSQTEPGENNTFSRPNGEMPEFTLDDNANVPNGNGHNQMNGNGMGNNESSTIQKIYTLAKPFGLMSCFTMATYWIVSLMKKRQKKQKVDAEESAVTYPLN